TITGFSYKKVARSIRYISAPALAKHHPKKSRTCFWAFFLENHCSLLVVRLLLHEDYSEFAHP
ncbi:MAG: hypothetical protein OEV18_13220, partial [Deltaproteobacteria bacterium]|nr:hypothetical protein [Deltaproteobacteria bacterium]